MHLPLHLKIEKQYKVSRFPGGRFNILPGVTQYDYASKNVFKPGLGKIMASRWVLPHVATKAAACRRGPSKDTHLRSIPHIYRGGLPKLKIDVHIPFRR